MRKNILRLKLAFTIMWVNVVYLIVTFSIEYINRSLFYNYGSLGNYIDFILFLFVTKVIPLTVLYFIILFVLLKPLQVATNQLKAGRELDEQLKHKALKNILNMSRTLIIANISGYVIGVLLRLYTEYGYPQLDSYEGWIQVFYGFAIGATLSLIQISINNLLLINSKRLFKLHYLEKKNNIETVFGIRIFWVGLFLIMYVSLYTYDNMRNSYEQEIKYSVLLESVVKNEITIEQAKGLYREEISKLLRIEEKKEQEKITFPLNIDTKQSKIQDYSLIFSLIFLVVFFLSFSTIYFAVKDLLFQVIHVKSKMRDIIKGEGDLTTRIIITENDAIGRVIDILNRFMENFRMLLLKIADSTNSIATQKNTMENTVKDFLTTIENIVNFIDEVNNQTSGQINVVNNTQEELTVMLDNFNSISKNIDNLVSFVEQTSTSMEEIGANINSVSNIAHNLNSLSDNLLKTTDLGKEEIDANITAIKEIEKSSKQVEEIVFIISDIASKTDLLAMNASIEAAHAGAAGKGFAVIADEISKLAENSANSAKEISDIISGISNQIYDSVNLSEKTGTSLGEIYKSIADTTKMIHTISLAMQEQNNAVSEIMSTISSVIDATNQTKSLTDEQMSQSENIKRAMGELIQVSDTIYKNAQQQQERNKNIKNVILKVQAIMTENTEQVHSLENELKKFKLE